jgi:hypothetical protein
MDFTYYYAGFIGLIVGAVAGATFVLIRGRSKRRLLATALIVASALNAALLINWAHVGDLPPAFLLLDFIFIAGYSCVGCILGASPSLLARLAWRKWRANRGRATAVPNSN